MMKTFPKNCSLSDFTDKELYELIKENNAKTSFELACYTSEILLRMIENRWSLSLIKKEKDNE